MSPRGQYSALNSFEFFLSSPPVGTDGATFTKITYSALALGQPPHSDTLSMSILNSTASFLLSDPLLILNPDICTCAVLGVDLSDTHTESPLPSNEWLFILSYLASHALGWALSQDSRENTLAKVHPIPFLQTCLDSISGS